MIRFSKITFLSLVLTGAFIYPAIAQQRPDAVDTDRSQVQRPRAVLRQLGLSQDQIRAMGELNSDIRAKRQAARLRVTEATRKLDQAIYADQVDEASVAQLLTDLQSAQAEVVKINFENELAVRRILTPEQLVKFREIRRRFNENREEFQRRRQERLQRRGQELSPGAPARPISRQTVKRGNN
jgi:protein CpxP